MLAYPRYPSKVANFDNSEIKSPVSPKSTDSQKPS
jgi:hypothetical protein